MKHSIHKISSFILPVAFFTCFAPLLFSQEYNIRFEHLTVEDGLVDNYVHGIFMDSKGYMWFSTQDGLSRYDGNSFRTFRQVLGDSTSLNFQIAMDVAEDEEGTLWIATLGGGLNRFDPETETFKAFLLPVEKNSLPTGKPFSKVTIGADGNIWGGTYDNGFYCFDKKKETFKNYYLNSGFKNLEEAFRLNSVMDILEDISDKNILWVAGNNGLYRFDKKAEKVERIPMLVRGSLDSVSSFRCLFMDKPGELWTGTWSHGLSRYFTETGKWEFFPHNLPEWEKKNAATNIIFDLEKKSPSEFWLASKDEGLMSFDRFSKKFTRYKHVPFNSSSILSDDAEVVYKDRENRVWVSNFHKGVSIIDPSNQSYHLTTLSPTSDCPSNNVFESYDAAFDVARDKLYVTTIGCSSIHVFNNKPGEKPVFQYSLFVSPDFREGLNVFVDSKKRVWVAGIFPAWDNPYTLFLFDPDTRLLQPFEHPMIANVPLHQYFINDIIEDRDHNIWFATSFGGVIKLDGKNNALTQYLKSPSKHDYPADYMQVIEINDDSKGNIWLSAVGDGLFKLDPNTETCTHYSIFSSGGQSLDNERIMCTEEGPDGKIWAGVEWNGVWVFDPALPVTQDMGHFGIEAGLPGSKVSKIIKDDQGIIWFRTNQGVCRYDEGQNKFVALGEKSANYYSALGKEGMALLSSGDIFVGNNTGFYTFNPAIGYKNTTPPPIVFADFKVNNKPYKFAKNLNYMDGITLGYQDNFFSIGFSALNYSHPELNRYAYILEGYDNDWTYPPDGQNFATYTKVGEGKYTFKVKASNNDGVWNEEGISLKIRVLPPLHRRWWAYLFYALVFFSGLYFFRKNQIKRLLEKADNERLKEMDSLKTKLYTNITHEFRTPLTVIMGMAEQLKEEADQRVNNLTSKIHHRSDLILRNSGNLLRLINQMLDLSKLDSGKLAVHWEHGDVVVFLQYLSESFHSFAEHKNIQLTFYPEVKNLEMDYDREKLQHIISNLLSNAIKFTPQGGKVYFHVSEVTETISAAGASSANSTNGHFLQIKISDTGIGIPAEHLPNIFDRFYQVDDTHTRKGEGTGIGLTLTKELVELIGGQISAKSEVGKGTDFTVQFPVAKRQSTVSRIELEAQKPKLLAGNFLLPESENIDTPAPEKVDLNPDAPLLLIIEDNPDVAAYIRTCMENQYTVLWAENGQLGIDRAVETIPDVIISDVMMPVKDGFEVTQFLKNDERTSHIPIILLTAKADVDSKLEGLERGADVYLSKPFDKKELLVRVAKLVELRRKLLAHYGGAAAFAMAPSGNDKKPVPAKDPGILIEDAFLKKVNQAIEKRLSDADFEVPHLCRAVRMSQSQLYRKIKALTDKSIAAYIRSYRLQKGHELLQNSDLGISEVAYEVGFSDPSYFSRTFSEEFGLPPNDLRK